MPKPNTAGTSFIIGTALVMQACGLAPARNQGKSMKTERLRMNPNRTHLALLLAGLLTVPLTTPAPAVGYVNVKLSAGYNFVANPLDGLPNNSITNVLLSVPDGTELYLWNVTNQVFELVATYSAGFGWDVTAVQLPPGLGFVLWVPSAYTSTFVGDVLQGSLTNFVVGGNKLCLLGSKVPIEGALGSTLFFPNINGADIQIFNRVSQSYLDACTFFPAYGWYDPAGVAGTDGPVMIPGYGFFVRNPGPDTNWVQNFIVPSPPPQTAGTPSKPSTEISSLAVTGGTVTLKVHNPRAARFDVQFSSDGRSWTTVATNQTGTVWRDRFRAGRQGFYQVVNP